MKNSILAAIFFNFFLGALYADDAKPIVFVAAAAHSDKYATPGTFIFTTKGEKEYLTINMFDFKMKMRVTMRPSPYIDKDNPERTFDATFISDDGLYSAIITGGFTNTYGKGSIAIRTAAKGAQRSGTIQVSNFTLLPLDLEESTDDK